MGDVTQIFNLLTKALQFVGAGVAVWGAIEIFQSVSENNPQAKITGIKLLASGLIMMFGAKPLIDWLQSYLPS